MQKEPQKITSKHPGAKGPYFEYEPYVDWAESPVVKSLDEAPKFIMAEGTRPYDHLVSTWLDFHDDVNKKENAAVEYKDALIRITPFFVGRGSLEPCVIAVINGADVVIDVALDTAFVVDIALQHALLPRDLAYQYIRGEKSKKQIEEWYREWGDKGRNDYKPVLAWHQERLERP